MTKHDNDHRPDPKAFADNLKGPMPVREKLFLFLRNNFRKIVAAKSCCGHPGEPGC
jgi:hypothetical protein